MNITNVKNIVVLKNLPSNLVEEAIVVLKPNRKIKNSFIKDSKDEVLADSAKVKDGKPDYIVKEAEMIVSNFISTVEKTADKRMAHNIAIKYRRLKIITIVFGVLTVLNLIIPHIY